MTRPLLLSAVGQMLRLLLLPPVLFAANHQAPGLNDISHKRLLHDDPTTPGWLVERLFHEDAISCPWLPKGNLPDADCKQRQARITALRNKISVCKSPFKRTDRVIGHRGAPLVAPEETVASWEIAAASGAGYLECDASVTGDLDLVCRHSNCDLDFTTDLVQNHPELNSKCSVPFVPGSGKQATCCTFDFTTEELGRLCAIMESSFNASAVSLSGYILGPPGFRTGALAQETCHKIVPFNEHLKLLRQNGYHAIPELKDTGTKRTQNFLQSKGKDIYWLADHFANTLADHGFQAWPSEGGPAIAGATWGVMQTFDYRIAEYWKKTRGNKVTVEYMWNSQPPAGANCSGVEDCGGEALLRHLIGLGVDMLSPPIHLLITNGPGRTIVPSTTAQALKAMKARSIGSWSLERQGCSPKPDDPVMPQLPSQFLGPCWDPSAWYYSSVDGTAAWQHADVLVVLDTLFKEVGLKSLFSDFPATASAYVNCVLEAETFIMYA